MRNVRPLIAIVDDEASVRIALHRLIRSAGLEAETFPSGAEFLESMQTKQPDCIVLDVHMPDINGFEVQAQLAKSGARVPVVIITGHDTPETRVRVMEGGAAAYLLKPVDDRMLLDAITVAIADAAV
jgi:FixJ family two-component response regulator